MPALAFDFLCSVFKEHCCGPHTDLKQAWRCVSHLGPAGRSKSPQPVGLPRRPKAVRGGFSAYRKPAEVSKTLALVSADGLL